MATTVAIETPVESKFDRKYRGDVDQKQLKLY